jgi:lysozyme
MKPATKTSDFNENWYFANLVSFITKHEGQSRTPYPDAGGFSIGIGHFIQPNEQYLMNKVLTDAEIKALFEKDLKIVENSIDRSVKVPLNENQRIALASLIFNIGSGAFSGSTLLKKLNAKDYNGASLQFPMWNKSRVNNVLLPNPVLTKRRFEEQFIFNRKVEK